MKKEPLMLSNITQDLKIIVNQQLSNTAEWRFSYIIPFTCLSLILGWFLKNVWIALLIFSIAAYHIVRYVITYREYRAKKKAILAAVDRADISVSVERLEHINAESIYEPHHVVRYRHVRNRSTKDVVFYYFRSGIRWRVPIVDQHYKWSKDYYVSSKGLENISLEGDEFYFISLQGYHDIAYIYPCKNFIFKKTEKGKG